MAERIGFIGLGVMGKPMSRNLLEAGYELVVHDRDRGPVDELVEQSPSVVAASSPTEVAEQADIVITILPDTPDVELVALGEDGLIHGMRQGGLLIDMSTISPAMSTAVDEALKGKGASALDAPVSGAQRGAISATLSIMVGGAEADFERARPLFDALGSTIVHCGPAGAGQTMKSCNQVLSATVYTAVSEALVYGSRAGLDPETIIEVLCGGSAQTRIMETRGPAMIQHAFDPGFRVELMRKDLAIAQETAKRLNVPLPLNGLVTQMYESLIARGRGKEDHSVIVTLLEDLANHRLGDGRQATDSP